LATNFFWSVFFRRKTTPTKEPYRGGVLQGYGYCQPEGNKKGHRQRETVALFVALQEVAM